ncbi:(4Fe-4S)-binding protein [Actinocrispum sp. NPDC049592]|uniref:ferredoxin n=1 Tax=Actinocrispum sp. NPDC049592 TaxID=3154835 RepID=UPI00344431C7
MADVVVRIDARRCELHQQCEGLSTRIFQSRDRQVVVGEPDTEDIQRRVRSCPMGALSLVVPVV